MRQTFLPVIVFLMLLSACAPAESDMEGTNTPVAYDPFLPLEDATPVTHMLPADPLATSILPVISAPTKRVGPTPTPAQWYIALPPTRQPGAPIMSPTPDAPHALPTPRQTPGQYTVQPGDTLGAIAQFYGISLPALMQANGLTEVDMISIGQILNIPPSQSGEEVAPDFKVIPDSELVYSPASAFFDVDQYIQQRGGYLASYTEELDGVILSAGQILMRVAQNYSVNPRLLLALLEHQSEWVSNPTPSNTEFPMGLQDGFHDSLYLQLTWAADTLNWGYYSWRANAVSIWVLADGNIVPVAPTINAGTAGVQYFFSKLDDLFTWQGDVTAFGLFQTYFFMFGNPFDLAIEPLVPAGLKQPAMQLPFEEGSIWSFTGGPHGGWDSGSAWAALDFGPPGETAGCSLSDEWVVAVADGWLVRSSDGAVMQDLDGDGYEQTGWVVFYMHIESRDRTPVGTYVYAGERLGHPSCEGGFSNGTHVHIARKYNGEWIAADGSLPFVMDGWVSSGNGIEYDGFLTKGDQMIEAWDGRNELNQIGR